MVLTLPYPAPRDLLISANIRKVAVELQYDWEEKTRLRRQQNQKVPQVFFETVLVHLLNLAQAATSDDLPPFCKVLVLAKKHHQLMVIQKAI